MDEVTETIKQQKVSTQAFHHEKQADNSWEDVQASLLSPGKV